MQMEYMLSNTLGNSYPSMHALRYIIVILRKEVAPDTIMIPGIMVFRSSGSPGSLDLETQSLRWSGYLDTSLLVTTRVANTTPPVGGHSIWSLHLEV